MRHLATISPMGSFLRFYLTTLSQYTSTDNVANIREGGRGRNRCSTLQKAHGGQYSVERNRWDTHEFRKSPPARGGQQTSARRGGGIRDSSHTSLLLWGP